jgi:hypothetical protein
MTDAASALTNDQRLKTLMKDVKGLGEEAALGRDSLPKLALKVAFASADSVISGDKDTTGVDDYGRIYAEYIKADSKKAVHEHTAGGQKANVSKLRQIGTASAMPSCDFYATINTLLGERDKQIAEEVKVRPCYASIVEAARKQLAQPDDLTPEQIAECIRKPDAADKSVEGELKRVEKILGDLISGEKSVTCKDQDVVDWQAQVAGKIATMQLMRERIETRAKALELGISLAPEVTADVTHEVTPELVAA